MNSLAALAITYLLMTICSASILYFSFNGKIDASGKYFFLGELTILPGIFCVALNNTYSDIFRPPLFFTINASVWISHVCILFSIYALTFKTHQWKFILAITSGLIYATAVEICRIYNFSINNITLIATFTDVIFSFWTYTICKSIQDKELQKNIFLSWIKNIEIIFVLFAVIRIISCFTERPINAQLPSFTTNIFYIFYLILNVFRYISYQSLRISWVDYRTNSINPLNKNLALVTQEKNNLLQGLIASNRVIGISALASSLAHQLSQPLTAIGLQNETLKRDLSKSNNNPEAITVLDKVNYQLSKLTKLVKNLRQLFNTNYHDFHEVNINSAVNELLEIIQPTLESKKIILNKVIDNNVNILGDAIQIQQVLINVINNSIDAIDTHNPNLREINLTITADNQNAVISIKDTGAGIDTTILPSIFELYKTSKKDGLGVGLWLSQTIIAKHHGKISATNSQEGGAIFTIQIPLAIGVHENK